MSFILDALRKSDARRQSSGAPGLNSPEPPRPPRRRRRRVLPWFGAALLAMVVTAAAVYFLQPEWLARSPVEEQQVENDTSRPASPQPEGESDAPEAKAEATDAEQLAREAPVPPNASDTAGEQGTALEQDEKSPAEPAQRDRRRPIPADPDRVVRREPSERESRPVPAEEATAELERRIAAERARRQRETPAEAHEASRQKAERESADSSRAGTAGESEPATEPAPLNEGVSEYLRAWELPLSVRRKLPELKLSIHVFSPRKAERFVLINGERYGPGDTIGEVDIVDISRDGAIVDFRSHRFLLEPR